MRDLGNFIRQVSVNSISSLYTVGDAYNWSYDVVQDNKNGAYFLVPVAVWNDMQLLFKKIADATENEIEGRAAS